MWSFSHLRSMFLDRVIHSGESLGDHTHTHTYTNRYDASLTSTVRDVTHTESRSVFHVPVSPSAARSTFDPSILSGMKQFGVPLETLRERNQGEPIPLVLRACAEYLEQHGKHMEQLLTCTVDSQGVGLKISSQFPPTLFMLRQVKPYESWTITVTVTVPCVAIFGFNSCPLRRSNYKQYTYISTLENEWLCIYSIHVLSVVSLTGLEVLGIFRRAPNNATVHQIKNKFDAGELRTRQLLVYCVYHCYSRKLLALTTFVTFQLSWQWIVFVQ